ncbi:MAG: FHA domain-containing protein [Chloroflexota bacterium]|nr:FHA domain-containing protein [Chloroflexota bacterium]
MGVASDDVEAASPQANTAPTTTGTPAASGPSPAAGPQAGSAPPADTASTSTAAPTPSGTQQARLVAIRYGAPTGQEIPLLGERLVVGRFDPETGPVDIDLSEIGEAVHVSRQHGELFREADGRWMVRDLGSTNGIFVKGSGDTSFGPRITAPRPLANGDEVTFGNARFVFRTD